MDVGSAEDDVEGEDDEPGSTTEVEVAAAGLAVDVEENLSRFSAVVFAVPFDDSSTLSCRR